jgi:hypothetical protein
VTSTTLSHAQQEERQQWLGYAGQTVASGGSKPLILVRHIARIHNAETSGKRRGEWIPRILHSYFGEFTHALRWIDLRPGSSRWTLRVLHRPFKGVVCYLLPSVLPHRVVRASRELLNISDRVGIAVVPDVRFVD